MGRDILTVRFFGDFTIWCGATCVVSERTRRSKALTLLQYLLDNRGQPVSQERLTQLLLSGTECADPVNTLKNIAYRARKLFLDAGLPGKDYIVARGGAYCFRKEIPCWVDVEAFSQRWRQFNQASAPAAKLEYCIMAMEAYKGDFLPRASGQVWAASRMEEFQKMFSVCVHSASQLLLDAGQAERALAVADQAVSLYPHQESYRLLRMSMLYGMRRIKEALEEYGSASATLFDELGVAPSAEMQELYQHICADIDSRIHSLGEILQDMKGEGLERGAFFCNYYTFSHMFRFFLRRMERSGETAFILLFTMTGMGETPPNASRLKEASQAFHAAATETLRRSDLYTRFSAAQFLVLLVNLSYENCKMVVERISREFKRSAKARGVQLRCRIESISACPKEEDQPPRSW